MLGRLAVPKALEMNWWDPLAPHPNNPPDFLSSNYLWHSLGSEWGGTRSHTPPPPAPGNTLKGSKYTPPPPHLRTCEKSFRTLALEAEKSPSRATSLLLKLSPGKKTLENKQNF